MGIQSSLVCIRVETRSGQFVYLCQMGHFSLSHADHWIKQTKPDQSIKNGICNHTLFQNVVKATLCLKCFRMYRNWGFVVKDCFELARLIDSGNLSFPVYLMLMIVKKSFWKMILVFVKRYNEWAIGGSIRIKMLVHMKHLLPAFFQSLGHTHSSFVTVQVNI